MNQVLSHADAYSVLCAYCKEQDTRICDLFQKNTLVQLISQSDWDASVRDAMEIDGLSHKKAIEHTKDKFFAISKRDLFYRYLPPHTQRVLMLFKAEEILARDNAS